MIEPLQNIADTDMALRVPLKGVRQIEASAGTGKTYTIAGLYVRLLVEKQLHVRDILVMTFTKAATEELRQRLRKRLRQCAKVAAHPSWLEADAPPPEALTDEECWALVLLRRTLQSSNQSADSLARRLDQAVQGMDEAAIFTIHGFCQRVLREHAALIENVSGEVALEPGDDDLLKEFAADAWLRLASNDDAASRKALGKFGSDPEALARTLGDLVDFSGRIEPAATGNASEHHESPTPDRHSGARGESAGMDSALRSEEGRNPASLAAGDMQALGPGLRRDDGSEVGRSRPFATPDSDSIPPDPNTLREDLVDAWVEGGDEAVAVFAEAFKAKHLNGRTYGVSSLDELEDMQQQLLGGGWPGVKRLEKFSGSKLANAPNKGKPPFPGHAAFDAIAMWLEADRAWQAHVDRQTAVVLHDLIHDARDWLRTRKRELARMSYADQIEWVHEGLDDGPRGDTLRDALRKQYPVALVDEFQDTDARQFAIFRRLYADHGALFCIGDPKQSIYGFRGGDVHAYLRARKLAAECWRLDRNYRSAPGLLAACAGLFGGREDVFVEPGIAFEEVKPGGHVDDGALRAGGQPLTPMTVWELPGDLATSNKDIVEQAMADACAGEIAWLLAPRAVTLGGDPLQPGSIAVLVDSNRQAMQVQDALAKAGVAAVCQRRESVFASDEATELRQILDALLTPRHAGLARGALSTRLLGRRLSDLRSMQDEDADWRAELDDLRTRWLERGVLAMIERLGEQHAARLLAEPGGERTLSNLMQLGDALQAEARRLSSAHAQRDWLAQRMALADAFNEDEQLRLESDADRVQIMTLHASKGLEFDLVFLPFAAYMQARMPGKGAFARFHAGDELVRRFILNDKGSRTEDEQAALDAHQHEELAEGVRKLYVGVTRARHACWLSVGAPKNRSEQRVLDWVLEQGLEPLMQRAGQQVQRVELPVGTLPRRQPEPDTSPRHARTFVRTLDRDWRSHSFSRLAEGGHDMPVVPTLTETERGERLPALAGLRGSRFGSAVHDALEHADFSDWAADPVPNTQRKGVARALAGQGLSGPAAEQAVTDLITTSLRTPMLDDLSLATLPPAQYRAEMEFHFGIAGVDPRALLTLLHEHGYQTHRQSFAHVGARLAGLMNGIIDLVFVHDGRWWIADYKTNHLGDHAGDYAPDRLHEAVRASDYDLQYLIYTVALHRWLRRVLGDDYDYARDFGGVRYLFLRGMGAGAAGNGIYADCPPEALIEALDRLLHAPEVAA